MKDIELLNKPCSAEFGQSSIQEPIIYIVDDEDFLRESLFKYITRIFRNNTVKDFINPTSFINQLSNHVEGQPFILITDMSFGETEIDGISS